LNQTNTIQQRCANCEAVVTGRFCAVCGQSVDSRPHSILEFAAEALEDITNADSRLWRTLVPLLLRPGRLTREFFAGRRARYLPPVRLYLVLSVAFFLVASFGGQGDTPQGDVADLEQELAAATDPQERAAISALVEIARRRAAEAGERAASDAEPIDPPEACAGLEVSGLSDRLTDRLRAKCSDVIADGGRAFVTALVNNLPTALFFFLPVLALFMKVFYIFSGRYYIEHLLFLLHNHAALFLVLLLYRPLAFATPAWLHGWLVFSIVLYVPWYGYRSLRTVYGQGRALTVLKIGALGTSYFIVGTATLMITAVFSALTL